MTTTRSPRRLFRRGLPLVAAGLASAGVLAGAFALTANGSAGDEALTKPAISVSPAPNGDRGAQIYTGGAYSVQLNVANSTGQTMTFLSDRSAVDGGHWNARPSATLDDQTSQTVTAYTDQPSGFTWNLAWQLDNGDYACVELNSAQLFHDDPHDISGVISTDWDDTLNSCGDPDPAFGGAESNSGGAHSWVDIGFTPASS